MSWTSYRNPCIVPDPRMPSMVVVVGVNEQTDDTLEVTRVDLSDINNPKFSAAITSFRPSIWRAGSERVCVLYPKSSWSDGIPTFYLRQLSGRLYSCDILANGTSLNPTVMELALRSSRLYSYTGNYNSLMYSTAASTKISKYGSSWAALVREASYSWYNSNLRTFPPEDAEISVGTYTYTTSLPAQGHLTVFNATGSKGWTYGTTSLPLAVGTTQGIQSLNAPDAVDMSGIVLSKDALPITMATVGYIIDKSPGNCDSTVLYSISPSTQSTPKLVKVSVTGNVPRFMPGRVGVSLDDDRLVLFGGLQNDRPTNCFHIFDTVSGTWSGPDLTQPCSSPSSPSEKELNIGAIVGGIAAGVVVLSLALFFIIRRSRRKHHHVVILNGESNGNASNTPPSQTVVVTNAVYHSIPMQTTGQPHTSKHVSQVYEQPVVYTAAPEHAPYMPPVIFQPQDPTYHATHSHNSTAYSPPLAQNIPQQYQNSSPTPSSGYHSGGSHAAPMTYADRSSIISPAGVHSEPSAIPSQSSTPQYFPPNAI